MKIKCENVVVCGNYNCEKNCEGRCLYDVVALDPTGKCAMVKPLKPKDTTALAKN